MHLKNSSLLHIYSSLFFPTAFITVYINLIDTVTIRSLRNYSLEGSVPDVSGIPQLGYLYVSWSLS